MVSWMAFIIPVDAIPGRVALLVTTFLVLINIANSAFSNSPTAQSINFIQVYLISCIGFVFCATAQYAFLLYMTRFHDTTNNENQKQGSKVDNVGRIQTRSLWALRHHYQSSHSFALQRAKVLDKRSLVAAPISFLIFNAVYWSVAWTL